MRYLVKLKPLEPFFFGGDKTFGRLGDKENGRYLVHSRQFPQQTAILGMIRKEILIQGGLLRKKRNGDWIDEDKQEEAISLVGETKLLFNQKQKFGKLKSLSPVFLIKDNKKIIKKVDIDSCSYLDGKLENYDPKNDIYDNYVTLDDSEKFNTSDIFKKIEQVGIKKGGGDNAYFKKTSYLLEKGFSFAFYIESDFELKPSYVILGAETSTFKMSVIEEENSLKSYKDKNDYLTLLSDAYITVDIKTHCDFAITSEISFRYLKNEFQKGKRKFSKSENIFLYEKGSIFINPSDELLANLNNKNLQQIGYNIHTKGDN